MLSTRQFTWNKATETFSAEISDLGNPFVNAYPDACDVGIVLVSHVTGKPAMFVQVSESRDIEGDVMDWTFRPTSAALRTNPLLSNVKVVIFND
jgi:hypothetical protein